MIMKWFCTIYYCKDLELNILSQNVQNEEELADQAFKMRKKLLKFHLMVFLKSSWAKSCKYDKRIMMKNQRWSMQKR